ncbi:unnamed protein product [Blepharisma stoltei]|uniref:NADH dehydrogenase [ubiquinone] 1 alpha subcomplex subunit 8 n=1 Tax=Blepharisma stoltei TaxID=1481888 RepID=A0AAU9JL26_9CILI|nr:unnamed protein product [Blepharisma stoltei]
MYSPVDEIILHAQRAFDVCREQVYDYEDCRQLDYMGQHRPELCQKESLNLLKCYEKVEEVEPICLEPMNNYRECFYKYSGNLLACELEMDLFNKCQENPKWYAEEGIKRWGGIRPDYDTKKDRPRF